MWYDYQGEQLILLNNQHVKKWGENTNTWLFFVNLCSTITYYNKIYLHMPNISVSDP